MWQLLEEAPHTVFYLACRSLYHTFMVIWYNYVKCHARHTVFQILELHVCVCTIHGENVHAVLPYHVLDVGLH